MRLLTWGSTTMTTLPPRPPLPPSGPPSGMFFSRRKLQAPGPPLPARATIRTRSTNIRIIKADHARAQPAGLPKLSGGGLEHVHLAVDAVELDDAVRQGEQGVVAPDADVGAGM